MPRKRRQLHRRARAFNNDAPAAFLDPHGLLVFNNGDALPVGRLDGDAVVGRHDAVALELPLTHDFAGVRVEEATVAVDELRALAHAEEKEPHVRQLARAAIFLPKRLQFRAVGSETRFGWGRGAQSGDGEKQGCAPCDQVIHRPRSFRTTAIVAACRSSTNVIAFFTFASAAG